MNEALREKILNHDDLACEPIAIPEWGITLADGVKVRTLSGQERDDFELHVIRARQKTSAANIRALMAVRTLVDANGERVFADIDVATLGRKSARALARVYNKASKLSGMDDSDVEELEKNSASVPSVDSGSA